MNNQFIPKMLPQVRYEGKVWFFDERLRQLRNIKNPHDYIDLELDYFKEAHFKEACGETLTDSLGLTFICGLKKNHRNAIHKDGSTTWERLGPFKKGLSVKVVYSKTLDRYFYALKTHYLETGTGQEIPYTFPEGDLEVIQ